MDKIEQQLSGEKLHLQAVKAPEEMEARLRQALARIPAKSSKQRASYWKYTAAAVVISAIVFGSNYNAFAYYSKKLLGFDELFNGTLQQLNEQGMGQVIDQTITLLDGTELTIDGIMSDSNQFILYYTLKNEKGLQEDISEHFRPSDITGLFTNARVISGSAMIEENQIEQKGMYTFEQVSPFAKTLKLNFWQMDANGQMVEDQLTFSYNPNKAMQSEFKQSIKKSVKVDQGSITFNTIKATPTMTKIEGKLNVKNFDRVESALHEIQLIANGHPVAMSSSGYNSSLGRVSFELSYDALPQPLESLELLVSKFVGYDELDAKLPLTERQEDPIALSNGKQLWINEIRTTSERLEITIATEENIMLDGVSVQTAAGTVELETTVNVRTEELADGRQLKQRTIVFHTTETPQYLLIKGMHLLKSYDETIKIKVD